MHLIYQTRCLPSEACDSNSRCFFEVLESPESFIFTRVPVNNVINLGWDTKIVDVEVTDEQ